MAQHRTEILTPFRIAPRQVAQDDNYSNPLLSFVGSGPLNQKKSSAYKLHLHTQPKRNQCNCTGLGTIEQIYHINMGLTNQANELGLALPVCSTGMRLCDSNHPRLLIVQLW